ncbi:hypothetical protein R6Q57_021646 [Mikania cordata]
MLYNDAKKRRKIRKLYVDSRKASDVTPSEFQNAATPKVITTKDNMQPGTANVQNNLLSSKKSSFVQNDKENVNRDKSSIYKHTNLQCSASPLSDITTFIANQNNNSTTPSSTRRYSIYPSVMTSTASSTFTTHDSLTKLLPGKRKLRSSKVNVFDMHVIDLTQQEEFYGEEISKDIFKSISTGTPPELIEDSKFVPLNPDDPTFGPPALLVVGFQVDEIAKIQKFLKELEGEFLEVIFCTEDMLAGSLWEAINTKQPNLEASKIARSLPRICFLSGLTGEEMMMFIDAFPESGLAGAVFAAVVPNSVDKPLLEVIEEIMGDHEMMKSRESS